MPSISDNDIAVYRSIYDTFDPRRLGQLCRKQDFSDEATRLVVKDQPDRWIYYKDNGKQSKVLFVAHLDSVQNGRWCRVTNTPNGPIVHSPVLDDRLGVYVGLDLLPKLGLTYDILLTTDEEIGKSTAANFRPTHKKYNWMFSFDRAGTDVVMYQYLKWDIERLVKATGVNFVTRGSSSDIAYLDHLKCRGFNWGVGYQDYHSERGYAWLVDTFLMISYFMEFFNDHKNTHFEYEKSESKVVKYDRSKTSSYSGPSDYFGKFRHRSESQARADFRPGWWDDQDSLDDQISVVKKEIEDAKEGPKSLASDVTKMTKAERRKLRVMRLNNAAQKAGYPTHCPMCNLQLKYGYCKDCKEDWWNTIRMWDDNHPGLG